MDLERHWQCLVQHRCTADTQQQKVISVSAAAIMSVTPTATFSEIHSEHCESDRLATILLAVIAAKLNESKKIQSNPI